MSINMAFLETMQIPQPAIPMQDLPMQPHAAPTDVTPMPGKKRARVLVMDDEAPILELTARLLGSRGYEVETATDGDQAVLQYRAAMDAGHRFDAVILDLTVPEKWEAMTPSRRCRPSTQA